MLTIDSAVDDQHSPSVAAKRARTRRVGAGSRLLVPDRLLSKASDGRDASRFLMGQMGVVGMNPRTDLGNGRGPPKVGRRELRDDVSLEHFSDRTPSAGRVEVQYAESRTKLDADALSEFLVC